MPKQITLDGLSPQGINIRKDASGAVHVEACYGILAGAEAVRSVSSEITQHLSAAQLNSVSTWYDGVFSRMAQVEMVV